MRIYHGSNVIVSAPQILPSERALDFGTGFYTTSNKTQAIRWAQRVSTRRSVQDKYVSLYEFDAAGAESILTILRFESPNYDWLQFVCANRKSRKINESYDIVIGPVANDTVYTVIQFYENGVYDTDEAIKRLKVAELYDQILFRNERALSFCRYIGFEVLT